MKKILVSITAILYFLITSGVVVNLHYCMNRLDSAKLYAGKSDKCSKCGMHIPKSKGCCRDELKIVKLQDDQKVQQFAFDFRSFEQPAVLPSDYIAVSFYDATEWLVNDDTSPPGSISKNLYLQNCVFRI